MGTKIEIRLDDDEFSTSKLNELSNLAFKKFEFVVKHFSRFDENSELSKLNRSSGETFKVSKELFYLIKLNLFVAKQTNYIFDPTIIDLLKAFGYNKNYNEGEIFNKLQEKNFKKQILEIKKHRKNAKDIELNSKNLSVKLPKDVEIDLGASAKGLAIDLACEVLNKYNVKKFLINAGGDIYSKGVHKIALFNPKTNYKNYEKINLKNEAIAGSGSWAKKVGIFSHIINPTLTDPKGNKLFQQVYVIAKNATIADIYSTALYLLGKQGIKLIKDNNLRAIVY